MPRQPLPCRGIRAADTVQPLPICQGCARWLLADKHGPAAVTLGISLADLTLTDGRLGCSERLPAEGA